MVQPKIGVLLIFFVVMEQSLSSPGHHHVHHRIHVPQKIKTIVHTKIIKVPEHHHYIREKEKPHIVKIPEHHHYFHEKEKEKLVDLSSYHKEENDDFGHDFQDDHIKGGYDFDDHHIFKKHAPAHTYKKKKRH